MTQAGQIMDPVSFRILWSRLVGVAEEASAALRRSAFSTIVSEGNDCTTVLFDERGWELAEPSSYTATSFIGTLPRTMKEFLARFPADTWGPGDVLISNDPWLGTGHLYDISIVSPLFRHGRLVAFTATCSHTPHIGGNGGRIDSRSTFEEGLRIPPMWLHRGGERVEPVFELIRANVPKPQQVLGDVSAQVGAHIVAQRHLAEIMEDAALESWTKFAGMVRETCSGAMSHAVAAIPDGEFSYHFAADGSEPRIEMACRIEVRGSRLVVDFAGSSPQVDFGINCPFHYTLARAYYALKAMLLPTVPNNESTFLPIDVTAPEGSILNPLSPAPTAHRNVIGHFVPMVVMGALNIAIPHLAVAEGAGPCWTMDMSGTKDDGETFNTHLTIGCGQGASARGPGMDSVTYPGNAANTPVEVLERETPLVIEAKELRRDSGGYGRFRGGWGQHLRLRAIGGSSPVVASFAGDRTTVAARGFGGGGAGTVGTVLVNGQPRTAKEILILRPGDELDIETPGGGGYGTSELDQDREVELTAPDEARTVLLERDGNDVAATGGGQ